MVIFMSVFLLVPLSHAVSKVVLLVLESRAHTEAGRARAAY